MTLLHLKKRCIQSSSLGYWLVHKTVALKKYWFVYFTACIRLPLTYWSAGTESKWHASVTFPSAANQDPLSVPWRTGRDCAPGCGFLRAEAAQGTGGSGWSPCSWGPLSSQAFTWFMWEMLFWSWAAEGVRREKCGERLLWCCRHCEGMLAYRSAHCVEHHAASFLQCGTASVWVHNTVNW